MTEEKAGRMVFVDGLRGVASLWVLFFHIGQGGQIESLLQHLPNAAREFVDAGYLGVSIFFVLSGFVIDSSLFSKTMSLRFFGHFVAKRSLRLNPPYWVALVVTVAAGLLKAALNHGSYRAPSLGNFAAHAFYLQDLLHMTPINDVYWTLALEIQMYVAFCAILVFLSWLVRRTQSRWVEPMAFGLIAVAASLYPLGLANSQRLVGVFFPYAYLFVIGVFINRWRVRPHDLVMTTTLIFQLVVLAAGALRSANARRTIVGLLTAVLILLAIQRGSMSRWMSGRMFQFLGRISYSLYLIHVTVLGPLYRVAFKLSPKTAISEGFWLVAATAISLGVAWVFSQFVEVPAMKLSRRIRMGHVEVPVINAQALGVERPEAR